MPRPEDPASRPAARAPRRGKAQEPTSRPPPRRTSKPPPAPRPAAPLDSDFGVAMLVCRGDDTAQDP